MNQSTNLFDEINHKIIDPKPIDIDSKWQQRAESTKSTTSIETVRSELVGEELSLRKNQREKLFNQRRLQLIVRSDTNNSLKDNLTISSDLYENCDKLKPTVRTIS
jgi:hypothetical protein